jgi:hypothetical protein
MRTFRKLQIASLLGILIVCTARISLNSYLPSGTHPEHFWLRTFWGCFLISLVWLVKGQFVAGVIFGRASQQADGVLPALETATFFYALTSISLMTISTYLPDHPLLSSIHMPAQIIMTTIFSTITLTLYIAYIGATHETRPSRDGLKVLCDLGPMLRLEEDRISQFCVLDSGDAVRLRDAIKVLRERISYSLPTRGSVTYSASYTTLSVSLQNVLDIITAIDPRDPSIKDTIDQTIDKVHALSREVGAISQSRRATET